MANAKQSSTYCNNGNCLPASNPIKGNGRSATTYITGTLWWQVSMTKTTVDHIVLTAYSYHSSEEITVSLYSGETLEGECTPHSGDRNALTQTLSCGGVTADRVRLSMTNTIQTALYVYGIIVSRVPSETTGLSLVSARILSSKTIRASRQCRVCGSTVLIINYINP